MNSRTQFVFPGIAAFVLAVSLIDTASLTGATREAKQSSGEQKWFLGHYVMLPPDTYTTDNKSFRVLSGVDGRLFQGLFMYVTLGAD